MKFAPRTSLPQSVLYALIALTGPFILQGQVRLEIVAIKAGGHPIDGSNLRMNNAGQVTGSTGSSIAIWQREIEPRFIYAFGNYMPICINDSGTVTGHKGFWSHQNEVHKYHSEDPFVWREATGFSYIPAQTLFEGPQDTWNLPSAINNSNFVVGTLSTVTEEGYVQVVKGWKWSSEEGISEIPPLEQAYGYESTVPNAINDHNVVVGMYGRNYSPSGSHYDGAFVYDAENGSRSLSAIDPPFFSSLGVVARDINNSNVIVGTITDVANFAYVYDLKRNTGKYFTGFGSSTATPPNAVPSAINNLGIVVGVADDWERAAPEEHKNAAFLWNQDSGIVRLEDFTTLSFRSILPPEADINEAGYEIYSINDHGQITGRISNRVHPSAFPYGVPFALYPTLTYKFELKKSVARPTRNLLVFSHQKKRDENSLSPGHFGKIVVHESSVDGTTWVALANGIDGVEIEDQAEELLIRLPEQPKVFLRSRMVDKPATAD